MTQTANLHNLSIVRQFARTADRTAGLPGIAALYGPAGFGKTTASMAVANEHRAYFVQMRSAWTRKTLLEKILLEIGIKPLGTLPKMLDQITDQLSVSRRLLIIDEFDYATHSDAMIELVRDIYEGSRGSLLIIGEEMLPQKLKRWERFHSRVLSWIPARGVTEKDAQLLVPIYCPGVKVQPDLLQHLVSISHGSVRRVCVNLHQIKETAGMEGWQSVGMAEWGERPLYTGEAPRRGA
ncbi:AAA family ATPase [Dentiradicibacter hellwigii]|uniref:ATP-binding protein n=1 Tax=Dentiradicibacter hellwigii TaxID=3149053 RepID=A0ABV4UAC5_9RHOO